VCPEVAAGGARGETMRKSISVKAILLVILTTTSIAQSRKTSISFGRPGRAALAYFDQIHAQRFDNYLKRIRPGQLSPELKAKLIAILPNQDIISPSAHGRDKLDALQPVLKHYGRSSVIDLKVIRMGQAVILFLAGAAVVISEEALDLLTAKELQAIISHELGHEYFWNEWQQARLDKQYEKMQENIESFANLEDNLRTLKMNLADIPYVLQYNKRDLPNVAPVEYMEFLLNNRDVQVPSFTAVASGCEGVFESLNMITRLLLHKFINESGRRPA